jgi:hypothetical protein
MDLLKHSLMMQKSAKNLIKNNNINKILNSIGDVEIIGSYKHKLMYDPDIDIIVKSKNPKESSLKALELFVSDQKFQKFEYGDFVTFPREKRPSGYIICLRKTVDKIKWEIEIWFLPEYEDILEGVKITAKKKLEILKAKHTRSIGGQSKHAISSYELYKKILEI